MTQYEIHIATIILDANQPKHNRKPAESKLNMKRLPWQHISPRKGMANTPTTRYFTMSQPLPSYQNYRLNRRDVVPRTPPQPQRQNLHTHDCLSRDYSSGATKTVFLNDDPHFSFSTPQPSVQQPPSSNYFIDRPLPNFSYLQARTPQKLPLHLGLITPRPRTNRNYLTTPYNRYRLEEQHFMSLNDHAHHSQDQYLPFHLFEQQRKDLQFQNFQGNHNPFITNYQYTNGLEMTNTSSQPAYALGSRRIRPPTATYIPPQPTNTMPNREQYQPSCYVPAIMNPSHANMDRNTVYNNEPERASQLVSLSDYTHDEPHESLWSLEDNSEEHFKRRQQIIASNDKFSDSDRDDQVNHLFRKQNPKTKTSRNQYPVLQQRLERKLKKKQTLKSHNTPVPHTIEIPANKFTQKRHNSKTTRGKGVVDPDYTVALTKWPVPRKCLPLFSFLQNTNFMFIVIPT